MCTNLECGHRAESLELYVADIQVMLQERAPQAPRVLRVLVETDRGQRIAFNMPPLPEDDP